MSNSKRITLPRHPSTVPSSHLPYAPLDDHDKAVTWIHEMYASGHKPIASLVKQAIALSQNPEHLVGNVMVACRPGGHSRALEEAKKRFLKDAMAWRRGEGA